MQQPELSTTQSIPVSRCDRWQLYQRLQELDIVCNCLPDGSFKANIENATTLLQIRSVMLQLNASRFHILDWLDRCWQNS